MIELGPLDGHHGRGESGVRTAVDAEATSYVVGVWIRATTAAEAHSLVRKNMSKLGGTSCRVYPSVVDDGVTDITVDVASRTEGQRLIAAIRRSCRRIIGAKIIGAWIFPLMASRANDPERGV